MKPQAAEVDQVESPPAGLPAWRVVGAVVRGVAHERLGMPCQDAQDYRVLPGGVLLAAVADGAGSASFSDQGARMAVKEVLLALTDSLESGLPADPDIWRIILRSAFSAARSAVLNLAETNQAEITAPLEADSSDDSLEFELPPVAEDSSVDEPFFQDEQDLQVDETGPREVEPFVPEPEPEDPPGRAYATTLTCAVATRDRLVVGQIGDGAVVAGEGTDLLTVTRLQRGEYANETHFLTQADALDQLSIAIVERPVTSLAVMSDGLIRLALKMPAQEPHAPFFEPLFRFTAGIVAEPEAARQLSAFLASERVSARTDDDKSLVLAVRVDLPRDSGESLEPGKRTIGK